MAEIIKIKVDASEATKATQTLKQLQDQVNAIGKTPTKVSFTVDNAGAVKTVTEYKNAVGEVTRVVMQATDAEQTYTKTVTRNYEKQQQAAQKQAEEFAKLKRWVFEQYRKWDAEDEKEAEAKRQRELKAQQKAEAEKNKIKLQQSRLNRKLDEEEERANAKAADKVDTLRRQYANLLRTIQNLKSIYPAGTFDEIEHQAREAYQEVNNLDKSSNTLAEDVKRLSNQFNGYTADVAKARGETQKLDKNTESLWMNFQKFMRWYVLGNFGVRIVRSLRDALSTMREVDQELINIQKVSNLTASEIERIGESAYATASKYGIAANEYLEAVYTFQKAGIGDSSEGMAELATKTMLVGDTTAEVATRFLISANAAWKFKGNLEELNRIVDEADKLNNSYAVTLEDIATGLPIVGATAAQVGMTAEQTMAAISTIVASTGQSASKAATALRAIIMNLIGQTGELEDGTKVTTESINTLNEVLNKYAGESMAAAQASGKILDPMEAIAALAKAAEDPLVKETQLFEILAGLGGKLRTTQLTALVNNLDMYHSMLADTANAAGTADREISIMLDSWNSKTQILKNTWTEFVSNYFNTDTIKSGLDTVIAVVDALNSESSKAVITLAAISTAVVGIGQNIRGIGDAISSVVLKHPVVAVASAVASAFIAAEVAARKAARAIDDMRDAATEAESKYQSIVSALKELEGKGDALTEIERIRLTILQQEADEAEREAKAKALSAYYAAYSGRMVKTGQYTQEWQSYSAQDKARDLVTEYYQTLSQRNSATSTAEINELEDKLQELRTAISSTANDLLDLKDTLGDKLPEAAENAITILSTFLAGLNSVKEDADNAEAAIVEETEAVDLLTRTLREAEELGVDLSQTVFGNIDTNNRQVIKWTTETLKQYKDELESWGEDVEGLLGEVSTVMGGSGNYRGLEIAFSPILQTDSGPVLLSADTVNQYINKLLDEADGNWSADNLLSLDWVGLEIDGVKIKGLLADIGDTAVKTGEAMHYAGTTGALALAGFKGYGNDAASQLKRVSGHATALEEAVKGVSEAMDGYGASSYEVYNAMLNLERTVPGATDGLYDLATASWEVEAASFADKEALLDFVSAAQQTKLDSLISELERASTAALDLAGSIAMALPGGYNEQFLEAYKVENNPALQKLKQQKAEWDAWITNLRQRSDYKPGASTTTSRTDTSSDPELDRLKNIVALRKSELELLKASGASNDEIIAKNKEIQAALHAEAEYRRGVLATMEAEGKTAAEINAYQADINALSTEWWNIEKNIKSINEEILKTQQDLFTTLQATIDKYYDAAVTDKEKELSLEEKILEVQKAQAALANAQDERNVRYFNAATGQWEWGANAKNVQAAEAALKNAQQALNDYQKEQAWAEFKSAWEYVAEQIKSGATTFAKAYDYMYAKMKEIQDTYDVDMSAVLEDSIGGFRGLNITIGDLNDETAKQLGDSIGLIKQRTDNLKTAMDAFKEAFDDVAKKVRTGDTTFEEAFEYLKKQADAISEKYGINMTASLTNAVNSMDKTQLSIEELWKQTVIARMKANSVAWFDADKTERAALHAENVYLANLIGAEYNKGSGYWDAGGRHIYDPKAETTSNTQASSASTTTSADSASSGTSTHMYDEQLQIPAANYNAQNATDEEVLHDIKESYYAGGDWTDVVTGSLQAGKKPITYDDNGVPSGIMRGYANGWLSTLFTVIDGVIAEKLDSPTETEVYDSNGKLWHVDANQRLYDRGGVLRGVGGIKATQRDEMVLPPDITERLLRPISNDIVRDRMDDLRWMLGIRSEPGSAYNRIGTQNNGDNYIMNGVSIGEQQARSMTVYDLAQMARSLGAYKNMN